MGNASAHLNIACEKEPARIGLAKGMGGCKFSAENSKQQS